MSRKQRRAAAKLGRIQSDRPARTTAPMRPAVAEVLAAGLRHHRAGRLAEAEAYYRRILAAQPNHADVYFNLGVALKDQGKLDEAVAAYRQVIRIKPDYVRAHFNLGNALKHKGKLDEAVAAYRRAIGIKPDDAEATYNLGVVLNEQSKLDQAIAAYRRAIGIRRDFAEAHFNLGNALKDQGKLDEAIAAYRQAIGIRPDYAEAQSNLGNALRDQGKLDEAVTAYRKATCIKPDLAEAHSNLGNALKDQGKLDEAIAEYRQAIGIKADLTEAYYNLGNALKDQGKLDEAVAAYRQTIGIKPDYAEAHSNLGAALEDQGKLDEAVAAYRHAISIKPNLAEAHFNLGNALRDQGRRDEAIAAYRQAISIRPRDAKAFYNLGLALAEQGKLDEARTLLEETLEFAPTSATTYRVLGYVKKFWANDAHLAAMEKLARDMESLSPEKQIDLHFALAKAYEDLGDHEGSFRHLLQGNALKRKRIVYDELATFAHFDRIRSVFTPRLMRDKRGCGETSSVPVFIIGMPRSGKTTVEQILASHPKFHGAGELNGFRRAAMSVGLSSPNSAPPSFPELVPALSGEQLRQLGTTYLDAIRAAAPEAERIGDTMPENFRFIGLVHLALPNARIIHMRRDPVEVCYSCFATLFSRNNHAYSYDLGELGRHCQVYETMMAHWRRVLPAGVMLEVKLEEVVGDAEHKTRELVAHCGLEWDEACLATASAIEVRQLIWWPYKELLQPLIKELGLESQVRRQDQGRG